MSQAWKGDGVVPLTLIEARPNKITLVRTKERDGYGAVQFGLGRTRREFKTELSEANFKINNKVSVSVFKEGDIVCVSGLSKGRGFQGVVKRHGFGGGPKTHGQKNRFRAPGSIGSTAPQRIPRGRKMAGHMGMERVTVRNLKVVGVDIEKNILMVKGAVPGARGTLLEIRKIESRT